MLLIDPPVTIAMRDKDSISINTKVKSFVCWLYLISNNKISGYCFKLTICTSYLTEIHKQSSQYSKANLHPRYYKSPGKVKR